MLDFEKEKQFVKNAPGAMFNQAQTLMTAAFGLVAALAWNDAVQSLVKELFGTAASGVVAKFGYALIITLVFTLISLKITKKQ